MIRPEDEKEFYRQAIRAVTAAGPNAKMNCGVAEALWEMRRMVEQECPACDGLGFHWACGHDHSDYRASDACLDAATDCTAEGCDEGSVLPDWRSL